LTRATVSEKKLDIQTNERFFSGPTRQNPGNKAQKTAWLCGIMRFQINQELFF